MIGIQQLSWNYWSTEWIYKYYIFKTPFIFSCTQSPCDQHLFNKFTASGISNKAITFNIMSHCDIPSMWSTNLEPAPKARFSRITTNPAHHQGTQVMAVVSTLRISVTGYLTVTSRSQTWSKLHSNGAHTACILLCRKYITISAHQNKTRGKNTHTILNRWCH